MKRPPAQLAVSCITCMFRGRRQAKRDSNHGCAQERQKGALQFQVRLCLRGLDKLGQDNEGPGPSRQITERPAVMKVVFWQAQCKDLNWFPHYYRAVVL